MDQSLFLILSSAALITAMISAILGMAGGILLLTVMTSFLSPAIAIPLHGVVQLVSNSTRSVVFFKHVHWPILLRSMIGSLPGACLSLWALDWLIQLDDALFYALIGFVILGATWLPKSRKDRRFGLNTFVGVGFMTGLIGPIVGATGPLIAPFFLRQDIVKEALVATKAICQAWTHLLKIPIFIILGQSSDFDFAYGNHQALLLCMTIAVVAGTLIGKKCGTHLPEKAFKLLVKIFLSFAGIRLFWFKGLDPLLGLQTQLDS